MARDSSILDNLLTGSGTDLKIAKHMLKDLDDIDQVDALKRAYWSMVPSHADIVDMINKYKIDGNSEDLSRFLDITERFVNAVNAEPGKLRVFKHHWKKVCRFKHESAIDNLIKATIIDNVIDFLGGLE